MAEEQGAGHGDELDDQKAGENGCLRQPQLCLAEDGRDDDDCLDGVVVEEKGDEKKQQLAVADDVGQRAQVVEEPLLRRKGRCAHERLLAHQPEGGDGEEQPPQAGQEKGAARGDRLVGETEELRPLDHGEGQ